MKTISQIQTSVQSKIVLFRMRSHLPQWAVLLLFLCFLGGTAKGQVPIPHVPDGTEGEFFIPPDTAVHKGKYAGWNQFDGPLTTLKLGFGVLYEGIAYIQDDESREQFDLEPTTKFRDARVLLSGKFKFKREITWKVGVMYDGVTEEWLVRESGVSISVPELWGRFFIGRTKEGFSMNKVMNGYAGWMMERQMALDVIPILADGIRWIGYLPKQHIFWDAGAFENSSSRGQTFSTFNWQVVARAGWVPIDDKKNVLHFGVSTRYGEVTDGKLQMRSRPEANPAPFFVDAGNVPADYTTHYGGEVYYRSGPLMMGTEFYVHHLHSSVSESPKFKGSEVFVSYVLTGETRPYYSNSGIFTFIDTKRSVFKGGPGTWEVILRLSNLDLNEGALTGGAMWRLTPHLNWYLSNNMRLEFVYGLGELDRFGIKGRTQFFQSRVQFML